MVLALALAAFIDGHGSNSKLRICCLRGLLHEILEKGYATSKILAEALIGDDPGPYSAKRSGFDPSNQVANL